MTELPLVVQMIVDDGNASYGLKVEGNEEDVELQNAVAIEVVGDAPTYDGDYTITPSTSGDIVLDTDGKLCTDDITVEQVVIPEYQGSYNVTPSTSGSITLNTDGLLMTDDVVVAQVPSGTAGTPTATKGAVSNHSVNVTPSVTNVTGYITGGTKTGTAVSVSASELVSGKKEITANGDNIDVTNYASAKVNVPNSYSAGDEGKVVSNGALVSQTSATYTTNNTYDTTTISSVTVNVSGGGDTPEAEDNDVIFIDYDGKRLYSYSAQEFAQLSAMPANPSHTGLTAQGWNWTLADAKAFVATYGMLVIGQHYITDDGKTRIYINIPNGTPSSEMTTYVRFTSSTANNTTVDWGDGTTETKGSTSATNYSHTYSAIGKYVITLTVNTGTISFEGNSGNNGNSIFGARINNSYTYNKYRMYKLEIGSNTSIGDYAFYQARGLETITIPSGYTITGTETFSYASGLLAITLPHNSTVTQYGNQRVKYVAFPKTVNATSSAGGNFSDNQALEKATYTGPRAMYDNNQHLKAVVIADNITSLASKAFNNCYILMKITVPSGVTSIGAQAFYNCYLMREYHFKSSSPPTLGSTNAFYNISSSCVIYVPSGSLSAYQTASNWSTYASRMVGE